MIKKLIDKYLNGETTNKEEQELLQRIQSIPPKSQTPDERAILMMLSYRKAPENEDIFASDYEEEYDRIVNSRKRRTWWLRSAKIAAVVALVAIVGTVGIICNAESNDNIAVAYVYGQETTDEELVMSMMKSTMDEMLSCSTSDEKLYELFNPE